MQPKSAIKYAAEIARWLDGGAIKDVRVVEYLVMKHFGWSEEVLYNTSIVCVENALFLAGQIAKHESKPGKK